MENINNRARLFSGNIIVSICLAVFVGSVVYAYSGGGVKQVCESGANCSFNESSPSEGLVGGTTNFNDLSVDSITNAGTFTNSGNLTNSGSFTNSGTSTLNGWAEFVKAGSFADATTTLFCQFNPFAATSTVDLVALYITGAPTSSVDVYVTTSTLSSISSTTTISTVGSLINAARIPANTTSTAIVNGITADTAGGVSAGTNTAARIRVLPNEFVCGMVGAGAGSVLGAIGGSNTFDGTYTLRFSR